MSKVKQQLLEILKRKAYYNPEDEGLAEFYSEVEGDCYSEAEMEKQLKHEQEREGL